MAAEGLILEMISLTPSQQLIKHAAGVITLDLLFGEEFAEDSRLWQDLG